MIRLLAALVLLPAAALADPKPPADLPPCPTASDAPDVTALLRRVEVSTRGSSSVGTLTMLIRTPAWSRTLKMKVWSRGQDLALVHVLEGGPTEVGMMTLKRDKQLWNYLPRAGRVMKLPSGMLGDSWMGSDFTNDDLVHGTSLVRDFDARLGGTTEHEGRPAWNLTLVPRPSAALVWGKIEVVLDRKTCLPLQERFFDDEGRLARTMTFSDIRTEGWRQFPGRIAVRPEGENRETVVTYGDMSFDVDIPDDTFSLHRLQQGR